MSVLTSPTTPSLEEIAAWTRELDAVHARIAPSVASTIHCHCSMVRHFHMLPISPRRKWMDAINERLAPFLQDRGLHWEIHIDETPVEFWTIDGFFPPPADSPDERRWAEENRSSQSIGG